MINKPKVALFSDLHLGVHGNSEDWHKIALDWADWIVSDLKKNKIKDIFFLGDFFDNRTEISVHTIHIASKVLAKFKDFQLFMIIGNHDAFYKNRSDVHSLGMVHGHDNIHVIEQNLDFTEYGKRFLFVPWENEIPDEKYDYIFGHFEIQSFKMNNFKVCDRGLLVADLMKRSNTIFSGHFHRRDSKKYSDGSIHYIGSTYSMDFSDVGNTKGYHILDVEDGSLTFIENTVSPKYKKILLSDIKKVKPEEIKGNIVKLVCDYELEDAKMEKVKLYLSKCKPHRYIIEYNTTEETIGDVEKIDGLNISEMLTEFIEAMSLEEEKCKRVKELITELYERNKV